jgi:energy-coupling factor transporter ATP-binding protein EcfA2
MGKVEQSGQYLVASLEVFSLFGKYSYRVSPLKRDVEEQGAPPLMLVYGDNGGGKTTILQILWHLLSPAPDRNHRTDLLKIPFKKLVVRLGNGDVITASKPDFIGEMEIVVTRPNGEVLNASYPKGGREPSQHRFVTIGGEVYVIADDGEAHIVKDGRHPNQDDYTDYLREVVERERAVFRRRAAIRVHGEEKDDEKTGLTVELNIALRRITEWLRKSVFTGNAQGSESVDGIYRQILTQLTYTPLEKDTPTLNEVRNRLLDLEARTQKFNEFNLAPKVDARSLISIVNSVPPSQETLAANILTPYISGQNARLDSLQSTENLLRVFADHLNAYLIDKEVSLSPESGFKISSDGQPLTSDMLSSGERQLILLLSNAFLARPNTSLFLIDEPELSLNVKWQRRLVESLLEVVKGSSVQFIMASHSIEIITKHRQYLAPLEVI